MKPTVDILEDFIAALNLSGAVLGYSNDGTNTTITVEKTFHTRAKMSIDIDGTSYEVVTVSNNESITVSGVIPAPVAYTVPNPFYFHGTPLMTNANHINGAKEVDKLPLVYLYEVLREKDKAQDSAIRREADLRLFFMDSANFSEWTTDDHYSQRLGGLNNLVDEFIEQAKRYRCFYTYDTEFDRTNRANWGVFQDNKGNKTRIFDDDLTAVELAFTLKIKACANIVTAPPYLFDLASIGYSNNNQVGPTVETLVPVIDQPGGAYIFEAPELPAGLSLNGATGVITETSPLALGSYEFDVIARGRKNTEGLASQRVNILVTCDVIDEVKSLLNVGNDRGFSLPSALVQDALSAYVATAKAGGWWTLEDFEWMLATDGDVDFACLNIVNPGDDHSLRRFNSPIFTPLGGIAGNLVNAYLDPQIKIGFDTVKFSAQDASVSAYKKAYGSTGAVWRDLNVTRTFFTSAAAASVRLQSSTTFSPLVSTALEGLYSANINPVGSEFDRDGVVLSTTNAYGADWRSGGLVFMATLFTTGQISGSGIPLIFMSVGAEQKLKSAAKSAAINTYLQTIGAI